MTRLLPTDTDRTIASHEGRLQRLERRRTPIILYALLTADQILLVVNTVYLVRGVH